MRIVRRMTGAAVIIGALLAAGLAALSGAEPCIKGVLAVAALDRSYEIHVPTGYNGKEALPLVVVLHGANASGMLMRLYSGFNELSDKKNFIVVYPDSLGPYWNDGRVDMDSVSFKANIDDVKFISGLIDHIVSTWRADARKVYIAGFSNGGMMALRLGIAIPEKVAAITSVSGLLPKHLSYLTPAKPVPVMLIHGTDDPIVPCGGGKLTRKHGEVLSAVQTAAYWSGKNRCGSQGGDIQVLADREPDDGTVVFRVANSCGNTEREVVLLTIQGGGHTWPGARIPGPDDKWGKTCMDFDASEVIWNFFSRHRRD